MSSLIPSSAVNQEEQLTDEGISNNSSRDQSSEKDNQTMTAGLTSDERKKDAGKPTIGEELFLVHMARHQGEPPSEDDFDREGGPRERTRSMGEELWAVHLARSKGMEPDIDIDNGNITIPGSSKETNTKTTKSGRKTLAKPKAKKPARCSERLAKVMHLRNRDVKKMMIS